LGGEFKTRPARFAQAYLAMLEMAVAEVKAESRKR